MKFSLINVEKAENGLISGVWLQDYTGSLEGAVDKAKATERANSNRIKVAVVDKINNTLPDYSLLSGLKEINLINSN